MKATGKARVRNEAGIHCRPSAHIIKQVQFYPGRMEVRHGSEGSCDLRSMLGLLMLGLTCGSEVEVEVEGDDAAAQLKMILTLLETEYDFPDAGSGG